MIPTVIAPHPDALATVYTQVELPPLIPRCIGGKKEI